MIHPYLGSADDDNESDDDDHTDMMNLLLRSILRKFTEDNGRGPSTDELMKIREALASKMGIELDAVPSPDQSVKKREIDVDCPPAKRVKFGSDVVVPVSVETVDDEDDVQGDEDGEHEEGK